MSDDGITRLMGPDDVTTDLEEEDVSANPFDEAEEKVVIQPEVWWKVLLEVVGMRFFVMMFITQFLLRGMCMTIMAGVALPLFENILQIEAGRMQTMMTIVYLAWSAKPIIGVLSDVLVFRGGSKKKPWLWMGSGCGIVGSAFLFLAFVNNSAVGICVCMMLIQTQIAVFDLMMESRWSALMNRHPQQTGTYLVVIASILQDAGCVIAASFVGPMMDGVARTMYYPLFAIITAITCVPLYFVYHNWIGEEQNQSSSSFVTLELPHLRSERVILAVVFATGFAAIFTVFLTNAVDSAIGLAVALVIVAWILSANYVIFPPMMFRVALFQVIVMLSRPSIGRALDFFYTASPECLPDGPHFPFWFYMTLATIIGTLASLLGGFIYQYFLTRIRIRTELIGTQIMAGTFACGDLMLATHANRAIGLPDKVSYVCGEAIAEPLIATLNNMPARTLLSKVVPHGLESSCYAFQAGIGNFAMMISEMSGALIFEAAGVRTYPPSQCNFAPLWWLILVCHVSLPIVGGVLAAYFLIPNILPSEKLE